MYMTLGVGFAFLIGLVITYGVFLKQVSAISIFILWAFLYVLFPILFEFYGNDLYSLVANHYARYDSEDLEFGLYFAIVTLLIPFFIDIFMIKRMLLLRKLRHSPNFEMLSGAKPVLIIIMAASFIAYIIGIFIYGVDSYFHGYQDELGIGTNYGSVGGSIISTADVMFFVSVGMLSRIKNSRGVVLTVAVYLAIHFLGGSRLMSVIGLLMIVLVHNNFLIEINKKFIFYLCTVITIFTVIGTLRSSGSQNLSTGFMEFGFVGFGYYNLIASLKFFDIHLSDFIKDLLVFSLPAFFDKNAYMSTTTLWLNLFSDIKEVSPVGGFYFLTELLLYIGLLSPIAVSVVFYIYTKLILFSCSLVDSKFSLAYSFFVGLMSSFVLVNLLRNGIFPAVSAAAKSVEVFIFLIVILRGTKFRRINFGKVAARTQQGVFRHKI